MNIQQNNETGNTVEKQVAVDFILEPSQEKANSDITLTKTDLIEQDFSFFDPYSESKDSELVKRSEVTSDVSKKPSDGKVIIEDLLGGFSEIVKSDEVENEEQDRNVTATSFFLLDFDNSGNETLNTPRNNDDHLNISLDTTEDSEVLSIEEGNLPFDNENDEKELASGFFFNDLLDDNKDSLYEAKVVPIKVKHEAHLNSKPQVSPNFQIGLQVATQENPTGNLLSQGTSEPLESFSTNPGEALTSILDIDVPNITAAGDEKEFNNRIFSTQESFVTEIEEFRNEDINENRTKGADIEATIVIQNIPVKSSQVYKSY